MKKKILYFAMTTAMATASLTSCSLEEYNPTAVTGEDIMATYDGLKGLESYCYSSLATELFRAYDYLSVAEGGTDCWLTPAGQPDYARQLIYYDGLATNTNASNKLFTQAYSMIGNCNLVIANASSIKDATDAQKRILEGEARCLRAFYYSILVNCYGNITLTTEPATENPVLNPQRSSIEALYGQMVEDLTIAANYLEDTPLDGNRARVTKKTARGLLARVYAQGGGEYSIEGYWEKARDTAESMIQDYGATCMYDDVEDVWAIANNRNNKEALFVATFTDVTDANVYAASSGMFTNCFTYMWPRVNRLSGIYTNAADNGNSFWYGRVNNNTLAPSKYLIDCFQPEYDKRWENTFTTAFTQYSCLDAGGSYLYNNSQTGADGKKLHADGKHGVNNNQASCQVLTAKVIEDYGLNPVFEGRIIYPYADVTHTEYYDGSWAYKTVARVWPKGDHSGDATHLQTVKNPYVIPYPIAEDEDRVNIYLAKPALSEAEKMRRPYYCINIDDLFVNGEYRTTQLKVTNDNQMFPGFNKNNWIGVPGYDNFLTSNQQRKVGDVFIMRMAEMYLIAAEANQQLGNGAKAAEQLNVLKKRAARSTAAYDAMKLSTATQDDVFDEYARELCGEYERWYLMKRHKDTFKARLAKGNPRAARNFDEKKHYLRPISFDFLSQIDNADEYGNNGY